MAPRVRLSCYLAVVAPSFSRSTVDSRHTGAGGAGGGWHCRCVCSSVVAVLAMLSTCVSHCVTKSKLAVAPMPPAGTLIALLDHCCSPFGRRRLRQWLCRPLYRIRDIEARQVGTPFCMVASFQFGQRCAAAYYAACISHDCCNGRICCVRLVTVRCETCTNNLQPITNN